MRKTKAKNTKVAARQKAKRQAFAEEAALTLTQEMYARGARAMFRRVAADLALESLRSPEDAARAQAATLVYAGIAREIMGVVNA